MSTSDVAFIGSGGAMKPSEALYAAADYTRSHGFSPYFGQHECARCLLGSAWSVVFGAMRSWSVVFGAMRSNLGPAEINVWDDIENAIGAVVPDVSVDTLKNEQWGADDAIAALEIAADICAAEGR